MKPHDYSSGLIHTPFRTAVALICAVSLVPGTTMMFAQDAAPQPAPAVAPPAPAPTDAAPAQPPAPKIPADQLDSLVAPIALYPDDLLGQVLVASTYPLEIIQLQQWLLKNKALKGKELQAALMKQPWDPSIQAMGMMPDLVKRLADDVQWTTDLGNAFLSQQDDVMDAVQRMRAKAQSAGNLKDSQQAKVETQTIENKQVIVIEQTDPDVVYVPSYNPTYVYGAAPVYPYPPIYYPPYYAGGMLLSWGVGVAMGAAWSNGGWGCGWGGGGNNVYVNRNNSFVNNANRTNNIGNGNIGNGNRVNGGGNGNRSNWQHNPSHRGGAPYGDRGTADKFGGRGPGGAGGAGRPGGAGGIGGAGGAGRPGGAGGIGGPGGAGRPGGAGGIGGAGGAGRPGGAGGIGGAGGAGRPGGAGGIGGAGGATRPSTRPSGGFSGGDRVGNRSTSPGGGFGGSSTRGGGFGGSGMSGGAARSSSARGASSFGGSSRGGGGRGGGGFSGGGARGGGGGARGGGGGGRR